MGSLLLREAVPSDAQKIAEVHIKTWQSAYFGLIPDDYLQSLDVDQRARNWAKILESSIADSQTIVAEIDGVIVGFMGIGPNREPSESGLGEVYTVYVDPNYQGHGVGSNLMEKGIQILKDQGFRGAVLWVLDKNMRTRTWYESRGWKSNGKSKTDMRANFELVEFEYVLDF